MKPLIYDNGGLQGFCEFCSNVIHLDDQSVVYNEMSYHRTCYERIME